MCDSTRNSHGTFSAASYDGRWEASLAEMSAWRVNDVVAYDRLREAATSLTAVLLSSALPGDAAQAEVIQLRRDLLAVDGFNRADIDELAGSVSERIRDLTGGRS